MSAGDCGEVQNKVNFEVFPPAFLPPPPTEIRLSARFGAKYEVLPLLIIIPLSFLPSSRGLPRVLRPSRVHHLYGKTVGMGLRGGWADCRQRQKLGTKTDRVSLVSKFGLSQNF